MSEPLDKKTLHFAPLWRPEQITWVFPLDGRPVIEKIRSKSARKFLKMVDQKLSESAITISFGECTNAEYMQWLELYKERTSEQHYDVLASPEWYQLKHDEGKRVDKLFAFQNSALIGGKIITAKDGVIRSAFKASQHLPQWHKSNASLGLVLDFLFLEYYSATNPKLITTGSSRNLFGVINSLGYLAFKLRMGYQPSIVKPTATYVQETEVSTMNTTCFYLAKEQKIRTELQLFGIELQRESDQLNEIKKLSTIREFTHGK